MTSQASARCAHVLIQFPSRNGGQTLSSGAWKGCRLPQGVAMATSGDGQAVMRRGLCSVSKTEGSPVARPRLVPLEFPGRRDQRNRRMLQESACANSYETGLNSSLPEDKESNDEADPPYTQQDPTQSGGDGCGSTTPDDTRPEVVECYQNDGYDEECFVINDWSEFKLAQGGTTTPDPTRPPFIPRRFRLSRPQATLEEVEECYQEDCHTGCFEIADLSKYVIVGDAPSTSGDALSTSGGALSIIANPSIGGGTTSIDPTKTPYNPRRFRYRPRK
eukprot:TRINITY_DN366_c0_g1_i4.p1 TRINITY_DN366_c0_g1~~TRINITY_DN366_c0_g1_i4.p1  ORF type:complete len:276 (-),score=22.87 TRINITY_DN366_c0_g1_i4:276-1103(-)